LDGLSERFLECVLADDYESAYRMVQSTVGNEEFSAYWQEIRLVAEGAEQYESEKRSVDTGTADGALYATATYLIRFDNGRIATLRITARSDYPDIAGIHFSDATDFLERTQTTVSVLDKVLLGARILSILFAAWMFVECLRSRIRYKALWCILICLGTTLVVTVGQGLNLHFNVGLFAQRNMADADPVSQAVAVKLTLPVGAILYRCLRKNFIEDLGAADTAADTASDTASAESDDATDR
jgi:hypothetical protein